MERKIVLAAGCFWGVEAYFKKIDGIINTSVGYANGRTESPTYEQVCNENTGYAEACEIIYDSNKISLEKILEYFWKIVDPTVLNRQGPDFGSQYRTGIYFIDNLDEDIITKSLNKEQEKYNKKIVTEVEPLKNYFKAEEYHQDYLDKNPSGYCHIDLNNL